MFKGTLSGSDLTAALDSEIARTEASIAAQLAPYDPLVTPQSWHRILQGAEELIHLAVEPLDDASLHYAIVDLPIAMAIGPKRAWLEETIRGLFDGGIETRILEVLSLVHAFDLGCASQGLRLGLTTVAHAAGYLHTRRRRMVSLFYVLPQLCRGRMTARTAFDLMPFMTLLELAGGPMVDLTQFRMLNLIFADFTIRSDGVRYQASRTAELLDPGAMDAERVSVADMVTHGATGDFPDNTCLDPRRLLSKAEVVYQIAMIDAAYAEFDISGTSFKPVSELILPLLRGSESHVVTVPAAPFLAAVDSEGLRWPEVTRSAFVHDGSLYSEALNGHQPFIRIDDQLVTNVTLLTRFLNDWKNLVLARKKRFQIRSGFLFEKMVSETLERAGFQIAKVRRIQKREFDVVTTKSGVIYNFQCKNTFIDSRLIEGAPARYARYNKAVVRSHLRALAKEREREQLLKEELGLADIRHHVVTRFPVLSDDADIIPFAKLADWLANQAAA